MKYSYKQLKIKEKKQLGEIKNIKKSNMLKVIDEIRRNGANKILLDIKKIDEILDDAELVCTKTDGTKYYFNHFLFPLTFIE